MKEQIMIQNIIRHKLTEAKAQNPSYSMRAYASKLGVHVGALSHILNGKRNVSKKLAERITRRLLLDPQERSEILSLFPEKRKYQKEEDRVDITPRYLELSAAQFKITTEWEHFAVMSLVNCEDFINKPSWISKRLGISESRASQVLNRLIEMEIFKIDTEGKIIRTPKSFRTSDDITDVSLKKHHSETLDLARKSLYEDSVSKRDFTTITMAIDPNKLSAAKELIRRYEDELSDLLESGHRTEVYRLSVQLFPITKVNNLLGELK